MWYTNVSAHIQDSDHSEDPNIPAIAHPLLWPLPALLQLPSLQPELLWLATPVCNAVRNLYPSFLAFAHGQSEYCQPLEMWNGSQEVSIMYKSSVKKKPYCLHSTGTYMYLVEFPPQKSLKTSRERFTDDEVGWGIHVHWTFFIQWIIFPSKTAHILTPSCIKNPNSLNSSLSLQKKTHSNRSSLRNYHMSCF